MQVNMVSTPSRSMATTPARRAQVGRGMGVSGQSMVDTAPDVDDALKTLTEEQKQKLREKYDIENIEPNSAEHKALLDELRDLGAISKSDYELGNNKTVYINAKAGLTRQEDLPAWSDFKVGNDIYKYYFHGQEELMQGYSAAIGDIGKRPFDLMMGFASHQSTQSSAYGRIADVLKDIFM